MSRIASCSQEDRSVASIIEINHFGDPLYPDLSLSSTSRSRIRQHLPVNDNGRSVRKGRRARLLSYGN